MISLYCINSIQVISIVSLVILGLLLLISWITYVKVHNIQVDLEESQSKSVKASTTRTTTTTNDKEITAAIMAAITCVLEQESQDGSAPLFRVTSIKKIKNRR